MILGEIARKKQLRNREKWLKVRQTLGRLDRDKIHILFFSYDLSFKNLYHNPLLLTTKVLGWIAGKQPIDHVAHISRFVYDEYYALWSPKIFEANVQRGMEENTLLDRLKHFKGKCYIQTLCQGVNKPKARAFEDRYKGVPYTMTGAAFSGLDLPFFTSKKPKPNSKGGFCSWLVSLFLVDQGLDLGHIEQGIAKEITPMDLFHGNLPKSTGIQLLFEY